MENDKTLIIEAFLKYINSMHSTSNINLIEQFFLNVYITSSTVYVSLSSEKFKLIKYRYYFKKNVYCLSFMNFNFDIDKSLYKVLHLLIINKQKELQDIDDINSENYTRKILEDILNINK